MLDRPRDKPFRTAVGVAAIGFFSVLTIASGSDLIGNDIHVSYERIIEVLQICVFVVPIAGFLITYRTCIALQRTGNMLIRKPVGGVIVRGSDGAYHTLGEDHGGHASPDAQHLMTTGNGGPDVGHRPDGEGRPSVEGDEELVD